MSHRVLAGVSTGCLGICLVIFGGVLVAWERLFGGVLLVITAIFVLALALALLLPVQLDAVRDE